MLGVEQPVFYRGEIAGTVRKYSDVLLIFLLKVTRPNIYRENRHVTADVNVTTISSHPNCDGTVQSWVCLSPAMSRPDQFLPMSLPVARCRHWHRRSSVPSDVNSSTVPPSSTLTALCFPALLTTQKERWPRAQRSERGGNCQSSMIVGLVGSIFHVY